MKARADSGQALVEFAIVLPILLLFVFGMIQFGLVLNARQTTAHAAQVAAATYAQTLERARAGSEAASVAARLSPRLVASDVAYVLHRTGGGDAAIVADGTGQPGDLVIATATYRYPSPVRAAIAGFRFPDAFPISVEGVARIERIGATTATSAGFGAGCYKTSFSVAGPGIPPTYELDPLKINGIAVRIGDVVSGDTGNDVSYETRSGIGVLRPADFANNGTTRALYTIRAFGDLGGPWTVSVNATRLQDPTRCA